MAPIGLSKLEVARRQLETAINLYFSDGDEVSIHTLAAASYNVIHDIVKKKKLGPMIVKDLLVEKSKPEIRDVVKRTINQAETFFKHANKDPEATLKFDPIQTEYLIFDAETRYQILTGKLPVVFLVFRGWFLLTHQNAFNFSPKEMALIKGWPTSLVQAGRKKFFVEVLPIASIAAKGINANG